MQIQDPEYSTWLKEAFRLISDLHGGAVPLDTALHRARIESLIPDLHANTRRSTNAKEKMLLATLELRARRLARAMNE